MVDMTKDKPKNQSKNVRRTLHYFWNANKKYKLYTAGALIFTPLVIFFRSAIIPLCFANMIDIVSRDLPQEELISALTMPAATLLIAVFVNYMIIGPLRLWCLWQAEISTMRDLGAQVFNVISAQSMQFHNNRFSGSLVSQTNKFISAYERLADEFIWNIYPVTLNILIIVIIMATRAPLYSISVVLVIIFFMVVAYIWFKKLAPLNEAEASASNRATGQLADSITNIQSVKSYARESYENKRYFKYIDKTFMASHNILIADTKRNFFFDSINIVLMGVIVILMMFGQHFFGLSIATLVLAVNYSGDIIGDLWSIHSVFKSLNRTFGDAAEMTAILDMEDDVVDLPGAKKLSVSHGEIIFDHISFKHQDAKSPIFNEFTLNIKAGERIGLVGVSGSGKTTLTKLLLRFADVNRGSILIDNQNIKNVTQESLRKNLAYVPQETSLFHRSIAENIAYGKPNASQAEIERAARLANAHEFIKDLPNGYNTLVGERGVKLSGGQRQRVAIARAILKDAPVLVLDEATSALDSESEALIQDALKKLMDNRTSLVIAHRLSTVANLDRIIVLDDGKIIEQGTHHELLEKGGAYSKLWSRQSGAFLDE